MPRISSEDLFIEEFITEYRKHKCLWSTCGKNYRNIQKREAAYEQLRLIALKHFGERLANKDYVIRKIKNLRTAFNKELKKLKESSLNEPYVPTLWYFDKMEFLQTEIQPRQPSFLKTLKRESEGDDLSENDEEGAWQQEALNAVESEEGSSVSPVPHGSRFKRKRALRGKEDYFVIAGKDFGEKLRSLEEDQRVIAEKLVSDIIFEGRLKRLKTSSVVSTPTDA